MGGGGGGLNREGDLNVNILPLKSRSLSEGGGLFERGGLIEDLQYFNLKNNDRRTNAANSCYYGPHWDCNLVSLPVRVCSIESLFQSNLLHLFLKARVDSIFISNNSSKGFSFKQSHHYFCTSLL